MASLATYELKITGLLMGPTAQNQKEIQAFTDTFKDGNGDWLEKMKWPLASQKYDTYLWYVGAEDVVIGGPSTQLTFQCMLGCMRSGTLYANRGTMLQEVDWFYHYCDLDWYKGSASVKGLKRAIDDLNGMLRSTGKLVTPVGIRDWKWYCGNGGGD
jgi:hypothetical protein